MKVISLAAMICEGVNRSVNEEFDLNDSTAMSLIATGLCRAKSDSSPASNENSVVPVVETTIQKVPVETSTEVLPAEVKVAENIQVTDSTSDKITEALSPVAAIENHLAQSGLEVTNKSVIESLAANGVTVTSAEVTAVKNRLNSAS